MLGVITGCVSDLPVGNVRARDQQTGHEKSSGLPPRIPRTDYHQRPRTGSKSVPSPPPFASAPRRGQCIETENKATPRARFRANPVNRRLMESPTVGLRKQKPQSPTRAVGFSFKTAERAAARSKAPSRDKAPGDLAKCFKALHFPSDSSVSSKKPRETTDATRETDHTRVKKEHHEEQRNKMEHDHRESSHFRAIAMPNFNRPVFCPRLRSKHVTEPENVELRTDRRVQERKNFDAFLKAKEEERIEALRWRESERKRVEEEEVRILRSELVHRAQPVKRSKPFEIKHSFDQVTVPHSPKFVSTTRVHERPPSRAQ